MTPPEKAARIHELHDAYVAATGYEIVLNPMREHQWWDWCAFGKWTWTVDDLKRGIFYLRAQIKADKRNDGALRFTNLVGMPDKFEEDLQFAREAAKGNPLFQNKPKPKASSQPLPDPAELVTGASGAALFRELLNQPAARPPERG